MKKDTVKAITLVTPKPLLTLLANRKVLITICWAMLLLSSRALTTGFDNQAISSSDPKSPSREQAILIKLNILVGSSGQAEKVELAAGQPERGIFSQWAVKQALKGDYPVLMKSGGREAYWLKGVILQSGKLKPLNSKLGSPPFVAH